MNVTVTVWKTVKDTVILVIVMYTQSENKNWKVSSLMDKQLHDVEN